MSTPSDPPVGDARRNPRRRFDDRGRVIMITVAVVLVVGVLSARLFASFYVDYLWHTTLGRGDVFWGVWRAKIILFMIFAGLFILLAGLNLVIADRLAPTTFAANTHPLVERFHELFGHRLRALRYGVAGVLGVLVAIPAVAHWQDWLLFVHARSFGIDDPQFGNDVGFYLFRLPFIAFALDWLFAILVLILLLVVATHVLNGGIVIHPPRPRVRNATKAHVAVLLAVLAVVKAGDYWLMRYELTYTASGVVRGAGYAGIQAQLPAIILLGLIALLVAGLFLSTLRTNSWRWPIVGSVLWVVIALVAGVIYPAVVQRLVVNPNKKDRELPYIARNIDATRHALGIDKVRVVDVDVESLTEPEVTADAAPLSAVRLFNPLISLERFRVDEGQRAGLTINDLDVDRYDLDGAGQKQVIVAARELQPATIPNKSWQGRHLLSTHGCGLVRAPAGQTIEGRPVYENVELDRPELYFSPDLDGYAIANTSVTENVCADTADPGRYGGSGGVPMNSFVRRLAFALELLDYNVLGSSAINGQSRMIINRSVQERVRVLAPFLSFDGDPYPVALDGRVLWVVDGYTTSNRYPYSETADTSQVTATSGLHGQFNYVRNSVKAVVDAYDGSVRMFIVDETDPVINVWHSAFPGLFEPMASMPDGLADHLRYPEDIFRVQTAAYSKYQLAPEQFFDRTGAWSVSQSPPSGTGTVTAVAAAAGAPSTTADEVTTDFATESNTDRFVPYYSMFRAPEETEATFQMYRPFVPFSTNDQRKELQSYMLASSDPRTYGELVAYRITNPNLPDGPATVAATMNSNSALSAEISLLDRGGSQVIFGDLQMVPVADSILWVRPLYVVARGTEQPSLRYVVVAYQSRVAFADSIGEAVGQLFPGFDIDLGDNVGGGTGGSDTGGTEPDPGAGTEQTPAELLAQADQLFAEADEALQSSDLATYAAKIDQARALIEQAMELLDVPPATSVPEPIEGTTDTTAPTS